MQLKNTKDTRILLVEGIADSAVALLNSNGYHPELIQHALQGPALTSALASYEVIGIRSRTIVNAELLANAKKKPLAIGCFSVGTNQVDIDAARHLGIPVFNAPFSNTRSVAELVIGEIVVLLRGLIAKSNAAHAGEWRKSAEGSFEVRGKTLGIVGYGNIGSQLSNIAESMGMKVIFFDQTDKLRHGNTEPVDSLTELLANSDVVSLHVPDTPVTRGMIGSAELAAMKNGAVLINNARGQVVDLDALAEALKRGKLAGAAIDVFPVEPKSNQEPFSTPLQGLENVILTPHIGGSTEEAQERIGGEVARKLLDYIENGSTLGAVNFPQVQMIRRPSSHRFLHLHENTPGILNRLNHSFSVRRLNIIAQLLQTDGEIGYVIIDAENVVDPASLLTEIGALPGTIWARTD